MELGKSRCLMSPYWQSGGDLKKTRIPYGGIAIRKYGRNEGACLRGVMCHAISRRGVVFGG